MEKKCRFPGKRRPRDSPSRVGVMWLLARNFPWLLANTRTPKRQGGFSDFPANYFIFLNCLVCGISPTSLWSKHSKSPEWGSASSSADSMITANYTGPRDCTVNTGWVEGIFLKACISGLWEYSLLGKLPWCATPVAGGPSLPALAMERFYPWVKDHTLFPTQSAYDRVTSHILLSMSLGEMAFEDLFSQIEISLCFFFLSTFRKM